MSSKVNLRGAVKKLNTLPHPNSPGETLYIIDIAANNRTFSVSDLPIGPVVYSTAVSESMYHTLQGQLDELQLDLVGREVTVSGYISTSALIGSYEGGFLVLADQMTIRAYEVFAHPYWTIENGRIMWPIKQIVIPPEFLSKTPRESKVVSAVEFFEEHGEMEKPIAIQFLEDGKALIKDGYARYLASGRLKRSYVWVEAGDQEDMLRKAASENRKPKAPDKKQEPTRDPEPQKKQSKPKETVSKVQVERPALPETPSYKELLERKIMWPIDLIEIPPEFLTKTPREDKIQSAVDYYNKHGQMEKPIATRPLSEGRMLLQDSYTKYLGAKQLGLDKVWIIH